MSVSCTATCITSIQKAYNGSVLVWFSIEWERDMLHNPYCKFLFHFLSIITIYLTYEPKPCWVPNRYSQDPNIRWLT